MRLLARLLVVAGALWVSLAGSCFIIAGVLVSGYRRMPETATDYLMAALAGFVAGLPYTFPGWIALIVGMIVWLRDPD